MLTFGFSSEFIYGWINCQSTALNCGEIYVCLGLCLAKGLLIALLICISRMLWTTE